MLKRVTWVVGVIFIRLDSEKIGANVGLIGTGDSLSGFMFSFGDFVSRVRVGTKTVHMENNG